MIFKQFNGCTHSREEENNVIQQSGEGSQAVSNRDSLSLEPVKDEQYSFRFIADKCDELFYKLWSKLMGRPEPVEEKSWLRKNILEEAKKCYTPSAASAYYYYHRRIEELHDNSSPDIITESAVVSGDSNQPYSDQNLLESSHTGKTKFTGNTGRNMGNCSGCSGCSSVFCPRLFCNSRKSKALVCCLAKILAATFQLIAIGAAFYFLHRWWILKAEYNTILLPQVTKSPGTGATSSSAGACGSKTGLPSLSPFVRKVAQFGLFGLIVVLPIALAIYYRLACSFYQYVYTKTYEEVREAQNDRILLENELMRAQHDPVGGNSMYDEIGDTKRHIMLGEIERISQYLMEAKEEIVQLMDEKDRLRMELRQAIQEKDSAKCNFDSAVKCIVQEDTKESMGCSMLEKRFDRN